MVFEDLFHKVLVEDGPGLMTDDAHLKVFGQQRSDTMAPGPVILVIVTAGLAES